MVGVEEGREIRFRRDLHSQESTFPLVFSLKLFAKILNLSFRLNSKTKVNLSFSLKLDSRSGLSFGLKLWSKT